MMATINLQYCVLHKKQDCGVTAVLFFYRDTIVSRQLDYFKRLSHFLLSQVPNVWNSCTSRIRSTTATSITRYL